MHSACHPLPPSEHNISVSLYTRIGSDNISVKLVYCSYQRAWLLFWRICMDTIALAFDVRRSTHNQNSAGTQHACS